MFTNKIQKIVAIVIIAVFVVGAGLGTWVLIARGQSPALPTNPDGSIVIPTEMIQQFEKVTGESFTKLAEDIKGLQERQKKLEPFYIQLRMNALTAAQIPANQYEQWQLNTEKKALVKIDPKTGIPVNK